MLLTKSTLKWLHVKLMSIILFLYQGDDHLPQVHALLKCTKEFKIAGNVMWNTIWQTKHVFFVFYLFFSTVFFFFFFLNPQFHISHYYVRSDSSATNSSRLLKKRSNPDLLSTSPLLLDNIYEFTHFWWNNKKKVHVELSEFLSSTSLFGNTFMLISQCQYIFTKY